MFYFYSEEGMPMRILPATNTVSNNARVYKESALNHTKISAPKNKNTARLLSPFSFQNYPLNIVPFTGSQKTPLTDEDYKNAREYFEGEAEKIGNSPYKVNIKALNQDKLNGLQKGIKVFDGLTMREIAFVLNKPILLLNRGCNNCCIHCGVNATPHSKKTLDFMSFEDFKSLTDGVKELESRMDNKVSLYSEMGLFLDSDCIDIELKDKDGNIHDCVDCIRLLGDDIEKVTPLFDTSGWNPLSNKHQKRAEKFVNFVLEHSPDELDDINVSINPYHSLYARAMEFEKEGEHKKAAILKERYAKRIANVLFTFSPLAKNDYPVCILARAIPVGKTDTGLDDNTYYEIIENVADELQKMYEKDLSGGKKYVQDEDDIEFFMEYYTGLMNYLPPRELFPWGRAQKLFNCETDTAKDREKAFRDVCRVAPQSASSLINPNGSFVLSMMDISARTDLDLNFENKGKPVKPFAFEIEETIKPLDIKPLTGDF